MKEMVLKQRELEQARELFRSVLKDLKEYYSLENQMMLLETQLNPEAAGIAHELNIREARILTAELEIGRLSSWLAAIGVPSTSIKGLGMTIEGALYQLEYSCGDDLEARAKVHALTQDSTSGGHYICKEDRYIDLSVEDWNSIKRAAEQAMKVERVRAVKLKQGRLQLQNEIRETGKKLVMLREGCEELGLQIGQNIEAVNQVERHVWEQRFGRYFGGSTVSYSILYNLRWELFSPIFKEAWGETECDDRMIHNGFLVGPVGKNTTQGLWLSDGVGQAVGDWVEPMYLDGDLYYWSAAFFRPAWSEEQTGIYRKNFVGGDIEDWGIVDKAGIFRRH